MKVGILIPFVVFAPACLLPGASSGDGGAPQSYGFGKPTLELTVNGAHFGPAAPDPGSAASLVNMRDAATGRVTESSFRMSASIGSLGAACSVAVQRTGDGVDPIAALNYLLASGTTGPTPDGNVAPIEGENASVPQGAWQCSGAACNGAGFVLSHVAADHVEGWLSAGEQSISGGAPAQIVCSFYLPWSTYSP
jgi:hypothetical protein